MLFQNSKLFYAHKKLIKYIDPVEIHYTEVTKDFNQQQQQLTGNSEDVVEKAKKKEEDSNQNVALKIYYGRNFVSEQFGKSLFINGVIRGASRRDVQRGSRGGSPPTRCRLLRTF